MSNHMWGDEGFDWKSLSKAMSFIYRFNKLVGNKVMMKEKYGTVRYEYIGWLTNDNFRFRLSLLLATILYPSVKAEIVEDSPGVTDSTPAIPWFAKFALKTNPWSRS